MKAFLFALCSSLALPLFAVTLCAQQDVPQLAYDSTPDYPTLPTGMNFGEVTSVAVNSKDHLFVFSRSTTGGGPAYAPATAQLFEFGAKGEYLREIGRNNYAWAEAHSVRIDRDDNIWAVDKGSDVIVKFNHAGRIVMVFGRRSESADLEAHPWEHPDPPLPAQNGLFRQPTDVGWDSDGNIYVTDGYVNSRVAKYTKDGVWVKSWGEKGKGPGQFIIPHDIVVDRNNNIYVGDRTNRRIQVFDTDGKFLRMFSIDVYPPPGYQNIWGDILSHDELSKVIGYPNAMCITNGPNQVLFIGEGVTVGRIFKVSLDGKVLGMLGHSGRRLKEFAGSHGLSCPSEHEVYVADQNNWRVQKLTIH